MKSKENQGFTSFDFLTMILSFAIILSVSVPILKKNLNSGEMELAQRDTDAIALSLLKPNNSQVSQQRGLASIDSKQASHSSPWKGDAGKDPWGNPYHYTFVRNKMGVPTHVVVWSDGPNMRSETPTPEKAQGAIAFTGDDVGSVVS